MRVLLVRVFIVSVCVHAVSAAPALGQWPGPTSVPWVVHDTSSFRQAHGQPLAPAETMPLSIYGEEPAGVPLWQATQTVTANPFHSVTPSAAATHTTVGARGLQSSTSPDVASVGVVSSSPDTTAQPDTTPRFKAKIFGTVKLDVIYNSARPQAPGVPFFLVPRFVGGYSQHTIDINARQSLLGVLFTGPKIGNFQSGGRISAVFFDPTVLLDRNGFLLQQSYGELFNADWRFVAGLQFNVFAPGLPTVLPFSYLGGSGSSGNAIRGQIRVEHFVDVGSSSQLILQGAISEPLNTVSTPDLVLDEDNGWPNLEARIGFGGGAPAPMGIGVLIERPVEVGLSGVVGQLRRTAPPGDPPRRVISNVWGAALDFRVNLSGFFGFKGEGYTAQGLGNYNDAILQSLDAVTWKAIRSTGGWVEGFVYVTPSLHSHAGIGIDEPNSNDITAIPNSLFGRTYNSTVYGNLFWDVDKSFRIALEGTYRRTEYKDPTLTGRFPNEGFGIHTQFQFAWR